MSDFSKLNNEVLLATLDDIVQKLAKEDNVEWAKNHDQAHRDFVSIKNEILSRMQESQD